MRTISVDTNIILRFLLQDNDKQKKEVNKIFLDAQNGKYNIHIDEIIIAEVIWVLKSYYEIEISDINEKLTILLNQSWIENKKKKLILQSLNTFSKSNLSFVDAWILHKSKINSVELKTLDKNLKKLL